MFLLQLIRVLLSVCGVLWKKDSNSYQLLVTALLVSRNL